jgi:hypothetical protein
MRFVFAGQFFNNLYAHPGYVQQLLFLFLSVHGTGTITGFHGLILTSCHSHHDVTHTQTPKSYMVLLVYINKCLDSERSHKFFKRHVRFHSATLKGQGK